MAAILFRVKIEYGLLHETLIHLWGLYVSSSYKNHIITSK